MSFVHAHFQCEHFSTLHGLQSSFRIFIKNRNDGGFYIDKSAVISRDPDDTEIRGHCHQPIDTLKGTQGMLRHASIKTTGDVYVQTIEQSVLAAVNSRTSAVIGRWWRRIWVRRGEIRKV
jgi:hypothetical protein